MEEQKIENKEIKEQKNMPLFVLKIVGNVIFYLIIILLLLFSIMNIRAGNRNDGFPNIFGKGFLSVQTNSMEGDKDDSFSPGDLLIVSVFNENDFDKLEVGQVVTFSDDSVNGGKGGLNSHRIVYIHRDSEGHIDSLAVQGDRSAKDYGWTYNPADQSDDAAKANQSLISTGNVQNLRADKIKGVMTSIWRGGGTVMDNLQKYWLFIFVLPVLLFLIFEIFMVVRNVMLLRDEKRKENGDSATAIDLEAQKEELRAQILAELRAEQERQKSSDDTIVAPTEEIKEPVEETAEELAAEPVAEESVAEEPVTEPVAEEKVAEEAVIEEPVAEEKVVEEPVVAEPVAEESVAEDPVTEPVAEENVAEEPVVEPVAEEKAAEEPKKKTITRKAPAKKSTSGTAKKTSTSGSKSTTKKSTASKSTGSKASTSKTGAKKTGTSTKKKTSTGVAKEKGE